MLGAGVELGAFLLVGLLGGAHCLGMCGPLATTYAERASRSDRLTLFDVRQQGLYTAGRVGAYTVVGAVLGGLGAVVTAGGAAVAAADPVRGVVGVVAGVAVLALGWGYLRGGPGGHAIPDGGAVSRVSAAVGRRADAWAGDSRIAVLGAAHALLPCPLLYPAYLYAVARGSPVAGALALGALGVGTAPAMVGYATAVLRVPVEHRVRLHRALGAAFLVLGLVPLLHGLSLLGAPVPAVPLPTYGEVPAP